jgi:lysophospholipase L1-like esterase
MNHELNPHYPLQYDEVFNPKVNANAIIMGASNTAHGINPKYLEVDHLKIYNFSMDGAGPSFNLKWYKRIFQLHYPKPTRVIYGVHWGMFDDRVASRKFEQDSKYFPFHFLLSEFWRFKESKTLILNRFALFRERKKFTEQLLRRTQQAVVISKYYNGFIPYERKGGLDKKKDMTPKNSESEIQAFEELLDQFEKSGIEVIFVQVPGYLPARSGMNIEESMKLINEIAENRKILFLDYDTKRITNINTDPGMHSDWIHLNGKGSDAFSKLLESDLELLLKRRPAEERGPSA